MVRKADDVPIYAQICAVPSVRLGKAVAKRPVPKQHGDHDEQVKRVFNTRLDQTSNMCVAISAVPEVVGAFIGRELVNELSDHSSEAGDGLLPRRLDQCFEF